MSRRQTDALRFAALRAMEHRHLAAYALDAEEELRMVRDRRSALASGLLFTAFSAGLFLGFLLGKFL